MHGGDVTAAILAGALLAEHQYDKQQTDRKRNTRSSSRHSHEARPEQKICPHGHAGKRLATFVSAERVTPAGESENSRQNRASTMPVSVRNHVLL